MKKQVEVIFLKTAAEDSTDLMKKQREVIFLKTDTEDSTEL